MSAASSAEPALPATIGVVGCGTIAVATVRGVCREGGPKPTPTFVISPRNAAKAASLRQEFPDVVRVATSNQEVVDATDCVIVAVLGNQAEEVLQSLKFREGQQVLSLVAILGLGRLRELAAPATACAIAVPLPAIAKRQGATLGIPPSPFAQAIYAPLGKYVAVEDEAQFKRMQTMTTLMGDFYKRQLTAQQWLCANGVEKAQAATWVGAAFGTFAANSAAAGADSFAELVAEQFPGGLMEQVWKEQHDDGTYTSLEHSLDSSHHRLTTGAYDATRAPAAKRATIAPQ